MIADFTKYFGNSLSLASATVATVSDDFRLWVVAILGLVITFAGSEARRYKDRMLAQSERQKLCKDCLKYGYNPTTCVVKLRHRPLTCPLIYEKRENSISKTDKRQGS